MKKSELRGIIKQAINELHFEILKEQRGKIHNTSNVDIEGSLRTAGITPKTRGSISKQPKTSDTRAF